MHSEECSPVLRAVCERRGYDDGEKNGCLGACMRGYLALWAFKREIPQYAGGAYVPYDSIWFEGDATRRGEKCFPA